MNNLYFRRFILSVVSVMLSLGVMAESHDFTSNLEVGLSKKFFKRLELGLAEEVAFKNNSTSLDKLTTKTDVSFAVVRKIFKVGVNYYLIGKMHKDDYLNLNHRFMGYTNLKFSLHRFSFAWKSRYQTTYSPEKEPHKEWKDYWRNRLTISFKTPKIKLYPTIGAELFLRADDYKNNPLYASKMRYQAALKYEFNKSNSIKLEFQYDDDLSGKDPQNVSNIGLGYHYSF